MTKIFGGIFNHSDRLQMESLNQRQTRSEVITANVANAETPGYRALGYDFEEQLQALDNKDEPFPMMVSDPRHYRNEFTEADGTIYPDVYVVPSESVGQDGNTVDVDAEMAKLSENQLLYQTVTELLNRKIGTTRYAITSGGR
jgi:flagellar basal-body rod protein FlgB